MKSLALSFVSTGKPPVGHGPKIAGFPFLPHWSRCKLNSSTLAAGGVTVAPSLNRRQLALMLPKKPTASRRVTEERLATDVVLNIAMFVSHSISVSYTHLTLPTSDLV